MSTEQRGEVASRLETLLAPNTSMSSDTSHVTTPTPDRGLTYLAGNTTPDTHSSLPNAATQIAQPDQIAPAGEGRTGIGALGALLQEKTAPLSPAAFLLHQATRTASAYDAIQEDTHRQPISRIKNLGNL